MLRMVLSVRLPEDVSCGRIRFVALIPGINH